MIKIKRVYESPEESDGARVLVDRLWPRGLSKASATINLWMKDIAPSSALRKWFGHDPEKWDEFRKRYQSELKDKSALVDELKKLEKENGTLTLLYGAKDEHFNQAVVLRDLLRGHS